MLRAAVGACVLWLVGCALPHDGSHGHQSHRVTLVAGEALFKLCDRLCSYHHQMMQMSLKNPFCSPLFEFVYQSSAESSECVATAGQRLKTSLFLSRGFRFCAAAASCSARRSIGAGKQRSRWLG